MISVICHALQGAEAYMMYVQDAEQSGEDEIAQFFREAIDESRDRAEQSERLLAKCLGR